MTMTFAVTEKGEQTMICYDCLHCDACSNAGDGGFSCLKEDTSKCKYFKNKADYVRVKHGENIGDVHPVDEFVCSECGIVLEGWTRVVTDEDDGELFYYEYEFKYCPNCGAKMDGGAE